MRTLHIGLRVSDLERSLAFYTAVGYEVVGEVPETEFVSLELVHDPARGEVDPGGLNHFVIHVEAMHDTVARLAELGIEAEPPASPDGSDDFWTSWLTDPDGYRIELVQWPTGHPAGMTRADMAGEVNRG